MEADVGAQVAPAFRDLPPLARKRDLGWHGPGIPQPNWSPRTWTWDSHGFLARPAEHAGGENLSLRLGGVAHAAETPLQAVPAVPTPPVVRPAKRVRSGSPGGGGTYPMCQVDDCRADLSSAKDYHRRHKVCEVHSKTTKALVGKQMQRFCQQCSRRKWITDGQIPSAFRIRRGKRSCRRRLAGHNRRRRKTQSEDASSRLLIPGNRENAPNGVLDVLNILSILARLQGNDADKKASVASVPDKDRLMNIITKINSIPSNNSGEKSPVDGEFDLNVPQASVTVAGVTERNETSSGHPTMDLLAVLSSALKSSTPEAAPSQSQGSSACTSDEAKGNANQEEPANVVTSSNQMNESFFPTGIVRNRCSLQSAFVAKHPLPELRSRLPLQLFSSTDDDSPPKAGFVRKYLSSESSNLLEERSPSSSPPIIRPFFPTNSEAERNNHSEDATMVEASTSQQWSSSFELLKKSERRVQNGAAQSMQYQAGYTSSGSDHSPSSSNSDAHDRTGRIVFKLFDKNPGDMPPTLRTQIFNWLSHIPSEMESYIRPGCVVLSLYLSMPPIAWDELKDLSQRVDLLLQSDESQFWKSGRFLVFAGRRLASHKNGRIRFCKSWRTWSSPELMSVSPLAVVSGKNTSILLRGRNLTVPGTKIHCTHMGGYTSKEILGSMHEGTLYDDSSLESFNFPASPPDVFGRCFIEVENGFKGNSFPVIIANESICRELRFLESELEDLRSSDAVVDDQGNDRSLLSREDILHFLNELGWLFQRRNPLSNLSIRDFSCSRFKFLLIFAVERDWSSLTAKLLDLLVERSTGETDLARESLETLSEIQLLSRAVKRKCKVMVDLLLSYCVTSDVTDSRVYIFSPNTAGPGGLTPLHLAASCKECEDMVDALTNDPQQIGLNCWSSCSDDGGLSPCDYAAMANNHSYNELVQRKLSDLKNHQVSIIVEDEHTLDKSWIVREPDQETIHHQSQQSSCKHCAAIEYRRCGGTRHSPALLRRPYIHSMLAIAAVCVCVCLFLRGAPELGTVAPFKWENVDYGPK